MIISDGSRARSIRRSLFMRKRLLKKTEKKEILPLGGIKTFVLK
jgi:hypothetical protein